MKQKLSSFLIPFMLLVSLTGCAQQEGGNMQPQYDSTKKMVVDMLQTEEGKTAIKEVITDEEIQKEIVMEETFVRQTIKETMTSEDAKKFWQDQMKDPEFAKAFAQSLQELNKELLMDLMKDPEYQKMMMDILKAPEMEKAATDLLKTPEYRKEVMVIMQEAFESPYFTAKINELLTKVTAQQIEQSAGKAAEEGKKAEEGK